MTTSDSKEKNPLINSNDSKLLEEFTAEQHSLISEVNKSSTKAIEEQTKKTLSSINQIARDNAVGSGKSSDETSIKQSLVSELNKKLLSNVSDGSSRSTLKIATSSLEELQQIDENASRSQNKTKLQEAKIVKEQLDNISATTDNSELLASLKQQNDEVIGNLKQSLSLTGSAKSLAAEQGAKLGNAVTGILAADSPLVGMAIDNAKGLFLKIRENRRAKREAIDKRKRDFARNKILEDQSKVESEHLKSIKETIDETNQKIGDIGNSKIDNASIDTNIGSKDKKTTVDSKDDKKDKKIEKQQQSSSVKTGRTQQKSELGKQGSTRNLKSIDKESRKSEKHLKKISKTLKIMTISQLLSGKGIIGAIGGVISGIFGLKSLFKLKLPSLGNNGGVRGGTNNGSVGGTDISSDSPDKKKDGKGKTTKSKTPTKKGSRFSRIIKSVKGKSGKLLNGVKNIASKVPVARLLSGGARIASLAGRFLGPAGAVAGAGAAGFMAGNAINKFTGLTNADGTANENNKGTKAIQSGLTSTSDTLKKSAIGRGALSLLGFDSEDPAIKKKRDDKVKQSHFDFLKKKGLSDEDAKKFSQNDEIFVKKIKELRSNTKLTKTTVASNQEVHLAKATKINNSKEQQLNMDSSNAANKALNVANKSLNNISNSKTTINNFSKNNSQNNDVSVFNMIHGFSMSE